MTPPDIGAVLTRIASATSAIRTRSSDSKRSSLHGNGDSVDRVRDLITKLEKVASELEAAIL